MKSLYEIDTELQLLMQQAEEIAAQNDGEISQILSDMLDKIQQERNKKIGNICRYYKSLFAEAGMVEKEAKTLKERADATYNKAEAFKTYLSSMIPGEVYSDSTCKVSWIKSKHVSIDSTIIIPDKYCRIKVKPDKIVLKAAIEAGEKIDGVNIVEKLNIQIK